MSHDRNYPDTRLKAVVLKITGLEKDPYASAIAFAANNPGVDVQLTDALEQATVPVNVNDSADELKGRLEYKIALRNTRGRD
jgi:hypothetical protein